MNVTIVRLYFVLSAFKIIKYILWAEILENVHNVNKILKLNNSIRMCVL